MNEVKFEWDEYKNKLNQKKMAYLLRKPRLFFMMKTRLSTLTRTIQNLRTAL